MSFDQDLEFIEMGVKKLKRQLEGDPEAIVTMVDKMSLYTKVYNLCTQRGSPVSPRELYDKYKELIIEYIMSTVLPSLQEKCDEEILIQLVEMWGIHKKMVHKLFLYFQYLDHGYVSRNSLPPLHEVGLTCFHDLVFKEFKDKVRDAIISMIAQQREGKPFDGDSIKSVLDIFVQHGIEIGFEEAMLKEAAIYYSNKASSLVRKFSYREYMLKANECLQREKTGVSCYLNASTEAALLEVVRNEFLSLFAGHYLEREKSRFLTLLAHENAEELSRMFRPFSKDAIWSHMAEPLSNIFKNHVHMEAIALARDTAMNGQEFIQKAIKLHEKCLKYINECFQEHDRFRQALAYVFHWLCNTAVGGRQPLELLASFCDDLLKKDCGKRLSDKAIEETFEKAVKLLPYVYAKDHFLKLYRENLARRLLSESANDDRERKILVKIKQQIGNWFQHPMKRMVDDITSTRENQLSFRDYIDRNSSIRPGIDFAVTVLSQGLWPDFKLADLDLPPEMEKCKEVFGEYYQWKNKDRKLTWIPSAGTCNVVGRFEPKTMELIMTPVQAAALLLFNSTNRLSYSEIMTQLNMTEDNVVGLLYSLSCAKHKILIKEPAMKTISPTDYFEFNSKFTDKMASIKIPPPPVAKSKKATEGVNKDCRWTIDASIVRIMKSQKVMAQKELVKECVKELGHMFKPELKMIKKRIEGLMARYFLERDSQDPELLRYLP
ncbi:hypothetical protein MLD38_017995 [Melastoma candidum]|uniref:Uncharacterized protein n=1 Tax=Melastoma candidum TaxID=119954 RepID=A0ACB9QSE2_9MYRT|nr:hypothetical protein MLD38_017995 [Melastoma candidum]